MSDPHYFSAVDVQHMTGWPTGKIYRLACADRWGRTEDGRRPVLYRAGDVEETIKRIGVERAA